MERKKFKQDLLSLLGLASFFTRFTASKADDKAVAFLYAIVENDDLFHKLCDMLGYPK